MDLKRAWRNGFLVSLIFALPLSDLYYFQQGNLTATGNSSKKPLQQANSCAAGTYCPDFENGNIGSGLRTENRDVEENRLSISGDSSANVLLASNDFEPGKIREAALRFTPQNILQSVNLNGDEHPDIAEDIKQVIDIGSIASMPFGFGDTTSYAPGHSGPYAPAMFGGGGNAGSAGGFQGAPEDATESSTQSELPVPSDTINSVPEPSSLVLMTIGTISVASLFHRRKPKSPTTNP